MVQHMPKRKLRQIVESIGDVWREVARNIETRVGSSKAKPFAHALRYQNWDEANKHYNLSSAPTKYDYDTILKQHSHYHDVHKLYHDQHKTWQNKINKSWGKAELGSKEHFFELAHKYRQLGIDKDDMNQTTHLQKLANLHHELKAHFRSKFKFDDHAWPHMEGVMTDATDDPQHFTRIWETNFHGT